MRVYFARSFFITFWKRTTFSHEERQDLRQTRCNLHLIKGNRAKKLVDGWTITRTTLSSLYYTRLNKNNREGRREENKNIKNWIRTIHYLCRGIGKNLKQFQEKRIIPLFDNTNCMIPVPWLYNPAFKNFSLTPLLSPIKKMHKPLFSWPPSPTPPPPPCSSSNIERSLVLCLSYLPLQ